MSIPGFDDQQNKIFSRPVIKTSIWLDPDNRKIDISNYRLDVGNINRSKEILGVENREVGSNECILKNHDDFFSENKRIPLNNVRNKIFLYTATTATYTEYVLGNDIFPTTKAINDALVLISMDKFYGLEFIISQIATGAISTYFKFQAYDSLSASWQDIEYYDLNTKIIGGLSKDNTTPYWGSIKGRVTWYNNTPPIDPMFKTANRFWDTKTINGFTGYAIRMVQIGTSSFSTIPKCSAVYFCPSIFFSKKHINKKIIHEFKFDTMENYVVRYVGLQKMPTRKIGLKAEKTATIPSVDMLGMLLKYKLGKSIDGVKHPWLSGNIWMYPTNKKTYSEMHNSIHYSCIYEFDVPEETTGFTIRSVYIEKDGKIGSYLGGVTTIIKGIGKIFCSSEPEGNIFVNISCIPYVNESVALDSFSPIGQIRAALKKFVYDNLNKLQDYYNTSGFSNTWTAFWDETSYNITKSKSIINCNINFFDKNMLEACTDISAINNSRLNFKWGDSSNDYGKYYSNIYHPDILNLFSITPKALDQGNDYEYIEEKADAEIIINSINITYFNSSNLIGANIKNSDIPFDYTNESSKSDYGEIKFQGNAKYTIDSEINIDIADFNAISGIEIKNRKDDIESVFMRKVSMLKEPIWTYKIKIGLKIVDTNIGDFISLTDTAGGLNAINAEIIIQYANLSQAIKENSVNIGDIVAIEHTLGCRSGQSYAKFGSGHKFGTFRILW